MPNPLDALIVSDVHIGSPTSLAKQFSRFLESIIDGEVLSRRLVVNGDLFENLDNRLNKHDWKVLSLLRKLVVRPDETVRALMDIDVILSRVRLLI